MAKNIKSVIWDWNGTLLNDAAICIGSINELLRKRSLPEIDLDHYRSIFTFPVKDYYVAAGFDFSKEPFEVPALQFIGLYREALRGALLHDGATRALDAVRKKGYQQYVLSVMEQNLLNESISRLGITGYFTDIAGIDNHYGDGKTELARQLVAKIGYDPGQMILVGDTIHDHEVAVETGIQCILVSHGHQSYERLARTGRKVAHNFNELLSLI